MHVRAAIKLIAAWGVTGLLPSLAQAATLNGRFINVTMDGSLSEWVVGDRLYDDSEIADGAPLNSTYSDVYVANDATYLYVGLKLKGNSSISSNWTHNLFIDTDLNASTGYNAGWMSGGYDRLIQYGAGGGSYSLFSFAGSAQWEWSWAFHDTIIYAFNGDVVEWAIPRSLLGGSAEARLQFLTEGGSVTVETWANAFESGAKNYAFAPTPDYTVAIVSAQGTPTPSVGNHVYSHGSSVSPEIAEPTPANGTQYVSLGWAMSGHAPASGSGTSFSMTVTNHATLTWLWQTNVLFNRAANGPGSISGDADDYYARGSTVNVTATPDAGRIFKGWSGDVPTGQTNDNPLALTMDRKRSITANFGSFTGGFAMKTMDGTLTDWVGADLFYTDAEIADGEPLASTYSGVYVANDHQYMYVAIQLKANSTIFDNWTHQLLMDTDMNPATGFNGGWMSGGYDRMVQYGAGGGSYSIFSFTGSGQWDWSWNFESEILYAYNNDVIEWAIPRSTLGGSTAMKLTFLTEGGSVTVQTWAHQTEAQARIYAMGATPNYTVTVASARGTPTPSVGNHVYSHGSSVSPEISEPTPANGTQYVSLGWAMSGHAPASGGGTSFSMTVTNHAILTWLWQTNVLFNRAAGVGGSVSGDAGGYYNFGDGVSVSAIPNSGYTFAGWSGDVPPSQANDNPLSLVMDRTRNITANFQRDLGRHVTITMDGSLAEWLPGDVFYSDSEITDGAPLNSTYSHVYAANDDQYLYIGLQLKANSSIFSNWTHNLFIDTDQNPATGYNAGWMSGGYDRLVQYGSGGGTYSIYSFSGSGQNQWSWNFQAEILYAYNNDVIEWAIPRAQLGGATEVRLQFLTDSGSVSIETWASEFEASAKSYAFSTPDGCVPGISPRMASLTDKTAFAGSLHSFTVTVNDPSCVPPALTIIGKPSAASFSSTISDTNRIGTFSWTPEVSDVGTYLLRFIATDDQNFTTSRTIRLYVGQAGDATNAAGIPQSQTNWAVPVVAVKAKSSGNVTVQWEAVSGVNYDIYTSSSDFGAGMSWGKVGGTHEASSAVEEMLMTLDGARHFVQIVPAGASPSLLGVWGSIKPTLPHGYTLMSPPLDMENLDLNGSGSFGAALAEVLDGDNSGDADKIYVRNGNSWNMIFLNAAKTWSANHTFAKGEAFYVYRSGGAVTPRFTGLAPNSPSYNRAISTGWNMVGPSLGKNLTFSQVTSALAGTPAGGWEEATADLIVIDEGNGSFRRIMKYNGSPAWLDLKTFGTPTITIQPGQGIYYMKQSASGVTGINF